MEKLITRRKHECFSLGDNVVDKYVNLKSCILVGNALNFCLCQKLRPDSLHGVFGSDAEGKHAVSI